ncbi:hypothetical protein BJ741DRAFT_589680 [Chytriomyces cf. hyalinus JEL632]|nr:hypothetical protein BJ741DRAFT_589680 [Chytriomyces cf. hyalinus JEL632]
MSGFARAAAAAAFAAHEEAERQAEESRIKGTFNRATTEQQRRQQNSAREANRDRDVPDAVLDPNADFTVDLDGIDAAKLETVPVEIVQLDALAVLSIVKHSQAQGHGLYSGPDRHNDRNDTSASTHVGVHGSLLGLDISGVLEVTNSVAAVGGHMAVTVGEQENLTPAAQHHVRMLEGLERIGYDANVVGLYVCAPMAAFWTLALLEVVAALQMRAPHAVLVVYDPVRTAHGNLALRALRLSQKTLDLMAAKKFSFDAIHASNTTPASLFESIPIRIKNSALVTAMLSTMDLSILNAISAGLDAPSCSLSTLGSAVGNFGVGAAVNGGNGVNSAAASIATSSLGLYPNFDSLDLGSGELYLEKHLESLCEAVDDYGQEQWRWQGWNRSLQKEQQKAAQTASKKRSENAQREANGQTPLHSESDITAPPPSLARVIANEPSRLETIMLAGQVDTWCKQIHGFAGPGLTKMYLTKAVARG